MLARGPQDHLDAKAAADDAADGRTVVERPPPGPGRGPIPVPPWTVAFLGATITLTALFALSRGLRARLRVRRAAR